MLQTFRAIIKRYPDVIPHLSDTARLLAGLKIGGYEGIRNEYWATVYDAVQGYLIEDRPVTAFRNHFLEAMSTAFTDAAYLGYEETSGETRPDDDTLSWLADRIAQEKQYIIDVFDRLKAEWEEIDPIQEAFARADGYAKGLDGVYNEAKLRGMKNQMVLWELGQTEKHCDTCSRLSGKRHRLSWLIENNYIPRKSDAGMDCHGYNCECRILDRHGNEITI